MMLNVHPEGSIHTSWGRLYPERWMLTSIVVHAVRPPRAFLPQNQGLIRCCEGRGRLVLMEPSLTDLCLGELKGHQNKAFWKGMSRIGNLSDEHIKYSNKFL